VEIERPLAAQAAKEGGVSGRLITVSDEIYDRLAFLRARMSVEQAQEVGWEGLFQLMLERERRRRDAISWAYTIGIFIAVTLVLLWPVYVFAPAYIPLILLVGVAVAGFSAYVLSPYSVRRMRLYNDAPPELLSAVEGLAEKAGLAKKPALRFADTLEINAYAYSSLMGGGVCLTRGLVDAFGSGLMSLEEMKAIIGHEIGHLKSMDAFRHNLALAWVSVFDYFGDAAIRMGVRAARLGPVLEAAAAKIDTTEGRKASGLVGLMMSFYGWACIVMGSLAELLAKAASALYYHLSRVREYAADDAAAELVHPEAMAKAMERVVALNLMLTKSELASLPDADSWQVQPKNPTWVEGLWDSHPAPEKRVERLRTLSEALARVTQGTP
jgi:heat shock protein HtpX